MREIYKEQLDVVKISVDSEKKDKDESFSPTFVTFEFLLYYLSNIIVFSGYGNGWA